MDTLLFYERNDFIIHMVRVPDRHIFLNHG